MTAANPAKIPRSTEKQRDKLAAATCAAADCKRRIPVIAEVNGDPYCSRPCAERAHSGLALA